MGLLAAEDGRKVEGSWWYRLVEIKGVDVESTGDTGVVAYGLTFADVITINNPSVALFYLITLRVAFILNRRRTPPDGGHVQLCSGSSNLTR